MAGPSPSVATQFWSAESVAAGGSITYELDTGQCYGIWIIVNVTTNPSKCTLTVKAKTGAAGTTCIKSLFTIELTDTTGDGIAFMLDPGTYDITITNNDTASAAIVDAWYRLLI